ncbi:MAG: transglycosylase domain-containing protein [Myxococcaceae bacterium]|nr:transglycosylase domain-containing protein [Myxococcaceae bacterium]
MVAGVSLAWVGYAYVTLPEVGELAKKNPPSTALIDQRAAEAKEAGRKLAKRQRWVSNEQIAKVAIDAVLLSEDATFFQHHGVDKQEMKEAMEKALEKGELGRGASTITMQLAKNLWLSTDRSVLRKVKELVLTQRLEEGLTKARILNLYLNVAEWGDGVYGIEAGAQAHFGVSAASVSAGQAVMLATMLPAPRRWLPSRKSKLHYQRALRLIEKLQAVGRISASTAAQAREEVERVLGAGKVSGDDDEAADE